MIHHQAKGGANEVQNSGAFQEALYCGESQLGAAHAQVGINYGLLGVAYWAKGEYAQAVLKIGGGLSVIEAFSDFYTRRSMAQTSSLSAA